VRLRVAGPAARAVLWGAAIAVEAALAVAVAAGLPGAAWAAAAVLGLSSEAERGTVQSSLQELVRKDLIAPERSIVLGEEGYRFRHLLIRDAAYNGIPKAARAELHERFALLIESSPLGFFDINLQTGEGYFSPRWKQMLGYEPLELPDQFVVWMELLHPDDLAKFSRGLRRRPALARRAAGQRRSM